MSLLQKQPVKVFISYAHDDKKLRDALEEHLAHLKNQGVIEAWHDGEIIAGQEWEPEILDNLGAADIILLLISAKFLASDYINSVELTRAMQRHDAGTARVIPVLLKPVFYQDAPFAKLESLPKNSQKRPKPVTKWDNRDEAYAQIAAGIHQAVTELAAQHALTSIPTPSISTGSVNRSHATAFPRIWNLTHQPNPNFTGRVELLTKLEQALRSGQPAALTQPQAIHGLGGVGKTQLAIEYVFRHTVDYDVVWWIRSEEPATLAADYAALAQQLDLREKDASEQAVVVAAVRQWLECNTRWLLIFDNANEPKDLDPYRPRANTGHILITSRNPVWRGKAEPLEVEELPRDEAVQFLLKRTGQQDEAAARKLADALGDLPLALEHAGAYVETTGISLADYLTLFEEHQTLLFDESTPEHYPASITKTWNLAFQQVQQDSPAAVDLLRLCAFLAPNDIPLSMIKDGVKYLPETLAAGVQNQLMLNRTIAVLRHYSLLDLDHEMLSVHRMVQAVTRDQLDKDERRIWAEAAVRVVNRAFPMRSDDVSTWGECALLLPHALSSTGHAETIETASEPVVRLLNHVAGGYLRTRALFKEAKEILEWALRIDESVCGPDHPESGAVINSLGLVLEDLGDFEGAKAAYERALEIDEAVYGQNHPEVAIDVNNLGRILQYLGDLEGAKAAFERALRIDEATYGLNHPKVAIRVNNLGTIFRALGDLEGAKAAFERALRIDEATYGLGHPEVATDVNNLGAVLKALGDLEGAKAALERALRIYRQFFREDHPNVVRTRRNLEILKRRMQGENSDEQQ